MLRFILNGRPFMLISLTPEMDKQFIELHEGYLGSSSLNWAKFEQETFNFLANTPNRDSLHNQYFDNFTVIWRWLLGSGRHFDAELLWETILDFVLKFEIDNPGRQIHKGTAYYFWGMTALLRGNLDRGYTLIHQAVEEDILTNGVDIPDTPAYALATLNYAKLDQAFRDWVVKQADFLNNYLNTYSLSHQRNYSLENFRVRFLNSPPNKDIAFLFAYTLARFWQLSTMPEHSLQNQFIGQLLMNLFFDITLCIDAAIAHKSNKRGKYITQAEFLSQYINHPIINRDLTDVNQHFNNNFTATLVQVLNKTLSLPSGVNIDNFQSDIIISYGIRNRGAHELLADPIIWQRYNEIVQSLFNVLFMTSDFLY